MLGYVRDSSQRNANLVDFVSDFDLIGVLLPSIKLSILWYYLLRSFLFVENTIFATWAFGMERISFSDAVNNQLQKWSFFSEFWRKCVMIKLRVDKILHKSEISYSVPGPIVVYWNIFIISWFVCRLLFTSISFKCICPETNRSSVCTKSNKHFKEDERFKRSTSHIRKIGENVKQVLRIQMTSIKATCCRAAWEGTYYTASRHIARSQYYSQHHCTEFSSLQGLPKKLLTECFWSHGAQSQSLVDGTPCVRKLFFVDYF